MPRPIGKRIFQACSAVERFGVCGSGDVQACMEVELSNVIKYLSRGVGLGLLTISRESRPHSFRVLPGWREKVKPIARVQPYVTRPSKTMHTTRTAHLQSVWAQV